MFRKDSARLEEQNIALDKRVAELQDTLRDFKTKEMKLQIQKNELEDKAGMLANSKLLVDYQNTLDCFETTTKRNGRLKKRLGHWWQGLTKVP